MCYQDKTFCPFWHDCVNARGCGRKLTDDVRYEARSAGLPIAEWTEPPDCHETKEPEESNVR